MGSSPISSTKGRPARGRYGTADRGGRGTGSRFPGRHMLDPGSAHAESEGALVDEGAAGAELSADEATLIARGIASAVAPTEGISATQVSLLGAVHRALTGHPVDVAGLEPLGPDELAGALAARPTELRHRVVHLMVLGELILRPIPPDVARRVEGYARALGIDDRFVRWRAATPRARSGWPGSICTTAASPSTGSGPARTS